MKKLMMFVWLRAKGLEPLHLKRYENLNLARLPIPPRPSPQVGFEPTTCRLTVERSTTELLRIIFFIYAR